VDRPNARTLDYAAAHCSRSNPIHHASSMNNSEAAGERRGDSCRWLALHLLSLIRTPCQLRRAQKFVITCYTMCLLLLLLPDEDRLQTNAPFGVTSQTKRLNLDCLQSISLPDDGDTASLRNIDHRNDTVSIEKCGCVLFTVLYWYEVGMYEFLPDLASRQIPVTVNTVSRLLMMDSKSVRNMWSCT
jgi:hypothetical protein